MKNLIIVLLVCFCSMVKAQPYFNNSYLFEREASVFRSILQIDDTLFVHGWITENFPPYPVKYVVAKIDLEGNVAGKLTNSLDTFTDYFTQGNLLLTKDSCFAFVGSGSVGYLIKIRLNGDTVFVKQYDNNPLWGWGYHFLKLLELPDSSFVILGNHVDGLGGEGSIIARVDSKGNLIWRKKFSSFPMDDSPGSITLLKNGNILMATAWGIQNSKYAFYNTQFRTYDWNGNLINDWVDTTRKTQSAYSYLQLDDGGGIYAVRWIDTVINYGGNMPGTESYSPVCSGIIFRDDSLHSKLWELRVGSSSAIPVFFQLKQLTDGNYLAVGGTGDTTWTDGQPYKNTGWLVKFTPDGQLLWERKYYNTSDFPAQTNYLYDFVELSDGNIIAIGERIDYHTSYPQRGWMLRLDSYGCLVPGCENVGIDNENDERNNLSVFPNPTNDVFSAYFNAIDNSKAYTLSLYSLEGRQIEQLGNLSNGTTYSFDLSNYSSGVYFLQLKSNNHLISSHKIIKL
jgi:hypothetical protein